MICIKVINKKLKWLKRVTLPTMKTRKFLKARRWVQSCSLFGQLFNKINSLTFSGTFQNLFSGKKITDQKSVSICHMLSSAFHCLTWTSSERISTILWHFFVHLDAATGSFESLRKMHHQAVRSRRVVYYWLVGVLVVLVAGALASDVAVGVRCGCSVLRA